MFSINCLILQGNDMVNFCPAQDFLPRIQTVRNDVLFTNFVSSLSKIKWQTDTKMHGYSIKNSSFCSQLGLCSIRMQIKCLFFFFLNFNNALLLLQIKVMLQEITRGIKGAMVEDNKFCLSVHFRCVNEDVIL